MLRLRWPELFWLTRFHPSISLRALPAAWVSKCQLHRFPSHSEPQLALSSQVRLP
jgi:hypothetical protein